MIRQEVAPPPPSSEATPLHPNGEVPSINSENAPPPAAASDVVNASSKTDASSAAGSSSDSKSETTSDPRLSPDATPPSSSATGDSDLHKDSESGSVLKVTEVKEPGVDQVEDEEAKSQKVVSVFCSTNIEIVHCNWCMKI